MKRKMLLLAALLFTVSLTSVGTAAYFTAQSTAHNVITAGSIDVELLEDAVNDEGKIVPFKDVYGFIPGDSVSKIIQLKNTGGHPAWVRIMLTKEIDLKNDEPDLGLMSYDIDDAHWTEKDGLYYYNTMLQPGETTEPLINAVDFSSDIDNEYAGQKFKLIVQGFATQADNNGATVWDATGWPSEGGKLNE